MQRNTTMQRNVELRKLPASSLCNIANILEINNDWQKVVALIPKDLQSDQFERKYNSEDMRLIENGAKEMKKKCAEVLFDNWGTSGRVRPTVGTLMKILMEAQIYRAVEDLADMLGESYPRRPENGPAAWISMNITEMLENESIEQRMNNMTTTKCKNTTNSNLKNLANGTTRQLLDTHSNIDAMSPADSDMIAFSKSGVTSNVPHLTELLGGDKDTTIGLPSNPTTSNSVVSSSASQISSPSLYQHSLPNVDIFTDVDSAILEDKNLINFKYGDLEMLTNVFSESFDDKPEGPVGKIGSGGFGDVYAGTHKVHGVLAVKRVNTLFQSDRKQHITMKLFNAEVTSLSHLRHENIVPIFGYSIDGPLPCIVCKYIDGGSLRQKIAAEVLTEAQRFLIIKGTAMGLRYIHHSERPIPMDVSESRIMLNSMRKSYYLHGDVKSANILLTKDCVPKLCDFGLAQQLETTFIMSSMMGTSAYMAPEGFSGTVTQKNDIYSFGIVLLELLTGFPPILSTYKGNANIKDYVEENCMNGDITPLLDRVVDKWVTANDVYNLAKSCLNLDKNKRPLINDICDTLEGISNKVRF